MKDFLLVYRADYNSMPVPTQEEGAVMLKKWMDWIGGMATQGKLTDRGNRLMGTGKVVKAGNVVTNGPYTEIKEFIGGYSIVKAASYDDAVALVKGFPIFAIGGNVEVREVNII